MSGAWRVDEGGFAKSIGCAVLVEGCRFVGIMPRGDAVAIAEAMNARPLFTAPPPPVDALAVVKRLRDTYARYIEEDREGRPQRALYNVGRKDAADEIIRELEGGR